MSEERFKEIEGVSFYVFKCKLCKGIDRAKEYVTINDLNNHLTEKHSLKIARSLIEEIKEEFDEINLEAYGAQYKNVNTNGVNNE